MDFEDVSKFVNSRQFLSPNCGNGDAGAGDLSNSIKSMTHCVALSSDDVLGILSRCGKNSTTSKIRVAAVAGM